MARSGHACTELASNGDLVACLVCRRKRCCLCARPQVQLGQNAADVVGGFLRTDEQLGGDLRVGQPSFEQREHVALPLGQPADLAGPWSRRDAETAQQSSGCRGIAMGT